MDCPSCSGSTRVLDTRVAPGGSIRRRRECEACAERVTTYERFHPKATELERAVIQFIRQLDSAAEETFHITDERRSRVSLRTRNSPSGERAVTESIRQGS